MDPKTCGGRARQNKKSEKELEVNIWTLHNKGLCLELDSIDQSALLYTMYSLESRNKSSCFEEHAICVDMQM